MVVTRRFPRFSETFVVDHVHALLHAGYEVIVVARRVETAALLAEFGSSIRAVQLPSWSDMGLRATCKAAYRAIAWTRGRGLQVRREPVAWKRAFYAQRLKHVLDQLQPDLVHAHFGPHGVDAAIALEATQTPLIVDFHGYDFTSFTRRHGWNLYHAALGHACLVVHSGFAQRTLADHGLDSVSVVMGVDRELFAARARPATWRSPLRLLCVGRLTEQKGHDLALQALVLLRRRRPDLNVQLQVIGAGPQLPVLQRLIGSLGIKAFVRGPAPAKAREVAAAMREADIALVPSRIMPDGWQEAFCRVAIEAMSTGLPVVATRSGGLPDTVGDGGVIAADCDAAALATAVERLLEIAGPSDWATRAQRSAARFDISRMRADYQRVTAELLAGSRGQARVAPVSAEDAARARGVSVGQA